MPENEQLRKCACGAPYYQPCSCGYVDLTTEVCWHKECARHRAELAKQQAVVDAAREDHATCQGEREHGLKPHPCKVCDAISTLDGEP